MKLVKESLLEFHKGSDPLTSLGITPRVIKAIDLQLVADYTLKYDLSRILKEKGKEYVQRLIFDKDQDVVMNFENPDFRNDMCRFYISTFKACYGKRFEHILFDGNLFKIYEDESQESPN